MFVLTAETYTRHTFQQFFDGLIFRLLLIHCYEKKDAFCFLFSEKNNLAMVQFFFFAFLPMFLRKNPLRGADHAGRHPIAAARRGGDRGGETRRRSRRRDAAKVKGCF